LQNKIVYPLWQHYFAEPDQLQKRKKSCRTPLMCMLENAFVTAVGWLE